MTEENLARYVDVMQRFRPRFIHAYPSSAWTLAQYLESSQTSLPFVEAWLLGSEALPQGQRDYIEAITGCRVFTWYGHSEKAVLAAECECESAYHPFDLYGVTELTDAEGRAIEEPGVRGAVTATGFITGATIFIRYLTDDTAEWLDEPCSCGRPGRRLAYLEGRAQEALIGRSGVRISLVSMNLHSRVYGRVRRFRFVQVRPGAAELLVVGRPGFDERDLERLTGEFREKLEGEVDLDSRIVEDLPATPAGKHRYIDQRIAE
jgi:phenylacetate-CoA ligase